MRALAHRAGGKRAAKMAILREIASRSTVVMLQEVHGTRAEVERLLREFRLQHWICSRLVRTGAREVWSSCLTSSQPRGELI